MGDDDDGLVVVPHGAEDVEEAVGLLGSEDGGGLVQDEDVSATVEHFDNFYRLLFRHGHLVNLLVGVDVEAVLVADGFDLSGYLLDVVPTRLLQTQRHVLRRGEHVHQFEVLVDHADAQVKGVLGGADHDLLAVDVDGAAVGEVDAGDHVHEGGLAAAVLPQQGEDLAPVHVHAHVGICYGLAEHLGDVLQPDRNVSFHTFYLPSLSIRQ